MIAWERAVVDHLCGGPHQEPYVIRVGQPMRVVTIVPNGSTKRLRKIRCEQCAGQAPPDLPANQPRPATQPKAWTPPMVQARELFKALDGPDFKVAQSGRD